MNCTSCHCRRTSRCRALSQDYEALPESSEAWIYLAMLHLMHRWLQLAR